MPVERSLKLSAVAVRARELARRMGLAGFWSWWAHELAAIVPSGARVAWRRRRTRPMVYFEGDTATLYQPVVNNGSVHLTPGARIALAGDAVAVQDAGRAAIAGLALPGHPEIAGATRIIIAVPPRDVLRKRLKLPAAVEEQLRQTLTYDLDRHTPFKPEEIYFDAVVLGRDKELNLITVDFAAIRRAVADPLIARVEAWGGNAVALVPGPVQALGTTRVNLLPPERRPRRTPWKRWQFWLPIGALTLFALIAIVLPLWQKREYAIALNEATLEARQRALVSEKLRDELDRQVGDFNFALERKYSFPGAIVVLEDVSRALPDDTWLTTFEMRSVGPRGKDQQRELSLRGESGNAGRLVSLLEESGRLTGAAPRSPTTKIQPGPGEIFDIGAKVKPVTPPATQPLVIASAAGAVAPVPPAPTPAPAAPGSPATAAPAAPAVPPTPAPTSTSSTPASATPPAPAATPRAATPASSTPANVAPPPAPPAMVAPTAPPAVPPRPSRGASAVSPTRVETPAPMDIGTVNQTGEAQ